MSNLSSSESPALAPWIAAQRTTLLAQRGHAWLLQGPSGMGQYALGLELVRAWLCDAPTPHGACGQCASCHAIEVRTHADLCVLMPEVQMMEELKSFAEKTFHATWRYVRTGEETDDIEVIDSDDADLYDYAYPCVTVEGIPTGTPINQLATQGE